MVNYEALKTELVEIAKAVEKFPEAVKPRVFELLVQTYLGQPVQMGIAQQDLSPPLGSKQTTKKPSVEFRRKLIQ